MNQSEFARLLGVHAPTVNIAIKKGRLKASVARDSNGVPYICDVDLARREWAANTSVAHVRRPENLEAAIARSTDEAPSEPIPRRDFEPPDDMSPAQAKAYWDAKRAEKNFRQEARELVPAAEVEAALTETFHVCKTRMLAIPSRAKQELPHLSIEDVGVLERLIREACEDLAVSP